MIRERLIQRASAGGWNRLFIVHAGTHVSPHASFAIAVLAGAVIKANGQPTTGCVVNWCRHAVIRDVPDNAPVVKLQRAC